MIRLSLLFQVDEAFCKIANASNGDIESGTTAVSVILGPNEMHVANTGSLFVSHAVSCTLCGQPAASVVSSCGFVFDDCL